MKRRSLQAFYIASQVLLDIAGLALAFQLAFWTRFEWSAFLNIFPAVKGIPDIALYQQALWALLPVCAVVFFFSGFYKELHLGAYDELVLVLKGVILCALVAMAMTFFTAPPSWTPVTSSLV